MTVALLFDGVDDAAVVGTPISNPCPVGKSIVYHGRWKDSGKSFQMFIDLYAGGGDFIATNTSGQLVSRIDGQALTGADSIAEDSIFKFEVVRTISDYKTYLDDVLQYTHIKSVDLDSFMGFSDTTFESEGQLHTCAVGTTNFYDTDASVHTAGTPVITDTIAGNDATGVNMPTAALGQPGSAWIDIGGGGISITEILSNSDSSSIADSILLNGAFNVLENTNNSDSVSNIDTVSLAAIVNVSDESDNSDSVSNIDGIKFVGAFDINDITNNTSSLSNFDTIQLAASIIINETVDNSLSLSNQDGVILSGAFNVLDLSNNSSSISNIDLVSFTSTIVVNDSTTNTDSVSNLDGISLIGQIVVNDGTSNSSSLSITDTVLLAGAVNISDSLNNTQSLSLFDSIQIGEFFFQVKAETNIDGEVLDRNINGVYYSTNING